MRNLIIINRENDSLQVIRAKQELAKFIEYSNEVKGRWPRVDSYNEKRINELTEFITQPAL